MIIVKIIDDDTLCERILMYAYTHMFSSGEKSKWTNIL